MAVTLLGYLENLILYQFGAYACFDLKTRMPWSLSCCAFWRFAVVFLRK